MKKNVVILILSLVLVAVLLLTGAGVPANYTMVYDVSGFKGNDIAEKMVNCDAYVTNNVSGPAICDTTRMSGPQSIAANTSLAASNIKWKIGPNTYVTAAANRQLLFTGSHVTLSGSGDTTTFDFSAWTSGTQAGLQFSGGSYVTLENFREIGNRPNSLDVPNDGHGGNCIQITGTQHVLVQDLWLTECGKIGISLNNTDFDLTTRVYAFHASEAAWQFNASDGSIHDQHGLTYSHIADSNTSKLVGTGQINVLATGGVGTDTGFYADHNWFGNNTEGLTGMMCNQDPNLALRNGCGQLLQIIDSDNWWSVTNNTFRWSAAECLAEGGFHGIVTGNNFDHCSQGSGGAGAVATYVGKQVGAGYIYIGGNTMTDSGYGTSLLVGQTAAADNKVFGPMDIVNNEMGTLVDPMTVGVRVVNSSCSTHTAGACNTGCGCGHSTGACDGTNAACTYSLQDVNVEGNHMRDVTNPISYATFAGGNAKEGLTGPGGTGTSFFLTSNNYIGFTGSNYIYNCKLSGASPINCGSASKGTVSIAGGATSVTVQTTTVTDQSEFTLAVDPTLGPSLIPSVTGNVCNPACQHVYISARVVGTSFTITSDGAVTGNPLPVSWEFKN